MIRKINHNKWKNPAVELPCNWGNVYITKIFNGELIVITSEYRKLDKTFFHGWSKTPVKDVIAWTEIIKPVPCAGEWDTEREK